MSEEYSTDLQERIEEYRTKMEQIAQNRSFLPLKYFEQAEGLIRNQILQSFERPQAHQILQKALDSWRNELYARNQSAISKWCGELLTETTNAIDKKICREIKSLTTYRQEIFTTLELLRKKTEPYISCELSQVLYQTFLQKTFQHMGQIQNSAVGQLQDHLKILEIENKALNVECKEAKRRTSKEDNESQRAISELKEKLSLAELKYSLLEQNAEELRQQMHSCQQSKEETIHKLTEDCNTELAQLRAKLQERYDQTNEAIKKSTFLQMELQKEQLLHKQTMLHYQELINSFHNKQDILKEEILQASRVSEKEIDQFRLLSTRRIEDWQQTANDLEEQLQETQKDLKEKESQIFALKESLISLKETSRLQVDELTKKNAHLEYHNNSLQDKESECQQLKLRIQKADGQLKKVQRDRDQLNELCRQTERQRLIIEQRHNQLKEELQKEHEKFASLHQELKHEREKREYSKLKKQVELVNRQSQTDEDINRQKLKAALVLIRQMETDYLKLQQSQFAMRRTFA